MPEGTGQAPAAPVNAFTGEPVSTPVDPAAAPPGDPAAPVVVQPAAGKDDPWYTGWQDKNVRGWVSTKNWKSPEAMAKSAYNLEKMMGAPADRLVKLPADPADAEGWQEVYRKLGAPEDPAGYGLPEDSQWLAEAAHKVGVAPQQLKGLIDVYAEKAGAAEEQAAQKRKEELSTTISQLRNEYGKVADQKFAAGFKAIESMGIDQDMADAIRGQIGARKFTEWAIGIGEKLGDGVFVEGSQTQTPQMGMTPDQAKQSLKTLEGDPAWRERFFSRDKAVRDAATAERARIAQWM